MSKRRRHPLDFVRHAGLEAASDAHYKDAAYYTSTYADRSDDIAYYVERVTESATEVLEYGCGNGRIALPLARCGVRVWGVDRSQPMLRDLRRCLKQERPAVRERVIVKGGDMRSLRLGRRFPLVLCTFNTFLHLYTRRDIERFCARVCAHLRRRGRFIVDVSVPEPEELMRVPTRAYRSPRFKHPSTGEWVRYSERFDYDTASQVLTIAMEFTPHKHPEQSWMTPLAHRQFYPQELEALLHYNGLRVTDVHADFDPNAPLADAQTLVYHCRKR